MVIVIARFRPRPERRDDLVALLEEVQAASRQDDGCLHYGYYTEIAAHEVAVSGSLPLPG